MRSSLAARARPCTALASSPVSHHTSRVATIVCPGCARVVPIDDVDLSTKLAKCRPCASVFDFHDQVRTPQAQARRRRELVPPRGYRILPTRTDAPSTRGYRDAGATRREPLELRRTWRSWRSVLHVLFATLIGSWSALVVTSMVRSATPLPLMGWIFGSLFAAPGFLAVAAVLFELVNSTRVRVDDELVLVRPGPLPWLGSARTASGAIRALHVRSRRGVTGGRPVFDVIADTPDDPGHVVVPALPTDEGARFVARQIAERLGIPDPD